MGIVKNLSNRCTNVPWILLLALAAAVFLFLSGVKEGRQKTILLWQVGLPDRSNDEFALSPDQYTFFKKDGLFVVGQSDSQTDWPYVHPGPNDAWAGKRRHTFSILFELKNRQSGMCRLKIRLLDIHKHNPPLLRIQINGQAFEKALPEGVGDAKLKGQSTGGYAYQFEIPFSAMLLNAGSNEIHLTTLKGSWFLYDWVGLEVPPGIQSLPLTPRTTLDSVQPLHRLQVKNGREAQVIRFNFRHFGNPIQANIHLGSLGIVTARLQKVYESVDVHLPAVHRPTRLTVSVEVSGKSLIRGGVLVKPVRKMTVFILPHSHTDVGYTESQTAVEKKHIDHLLKGIEYARQTARYPPGSRFVWNLEVLWTADKYLQRLPPDRRDEFMKAVRKGQVALNGMYLNELTALCRPEELIRLFRFSTRLAGQGRFPIEASMISDIPGCTWATVTAMAQAGIKYFSTAPNYFDRIGDTLLQWENKPFYWVSPSGRDKVLVWIPSMGYALSHLEKRLTADFVETYMDQLEKKGYPYDIAHIRWSGQGDNAGPDLNLCHFVREWNSRYAWPKFIISSVREAFRIFEGRYGKHLPRFQGDWTPYWEDGAGSSALETAMNRNSADRLAQAETLWAMLNPARYPAASFEEAWRNVLLFSEHTWGAQNSVTEPFSKTTREQWEIKRSFAVQADRQSRELLMQALESRGEKGRPSAPKGTASARNAEELLHEIDVFNTTSWSRTDLVLLSKELSASGDWLIDDQGRPVPSQRLSTGELAFVAREVPPLAGRRYRLSAGTPFQEGSATASGRLLKNSLLQVQIDQRTGGISDLRAKNIEINLVDTASGHWLNDYLYLPGDDPSKIQRNGPVHITVKEQGPLVASLLITSSAPGCRTLLREVRLIAGFDYVELINIVDKKRLVAKNYLDKEGKEGVHFAFPFRVPDGKVVCDIPLGVMRPEVDQIPGACKNWLTIGRWADVANRDFGVTWITLDAPLLQVGGITATLLNSQSDPDRWRKRIEPTQKLYSWVMNNHWGTNYRAFQEGRVTFRFVLRPHLRTDPAESSRLATGFSQPLIPTMAKGPRPSSTPLFSLDSKEVLVAGLKPSDDGQAWIIRLFGASGRKVKTRLRWGEPAVNQTWLSNTSERPIRKMTDAIDVPAYGLLTLRADVSGMGDSAQKSQLHFSLSR